MKAMVLEGARRELRGRELALPTPDRGEVRVKVEACAVCRTDLHVVDGDLPSPKTPLIPGHEIVGTIDAIGGGVSSVRLGDRVGVSWLARTCGRCSFCLAGRENLCDAPLFTGYTRDGGFAEYALADSGFIFPLPGVTSPAATAPLMCAGLIGWRSLKAAGDAETIGIYGFGAAAHLLTQICVREGRRIFAFTRPGDADAQRFATELGAAWSGGSDETPPRALDAAIIFAPAGELVPIALRHTRKGGRVVCGGIHMSDIPRFPYALLWQEREIRSVANLTRQDGYEFLEAARSAGLLAQVTTYPLAEANAALGDLRAGRVRGAAVLVP